MQSQFFEHLIHAGLVNQHKMRAIITHQRKHGGEVLDLLLETHTISDTDLAHALGSFFKIDLLDIRRVTPRSEALNFATFDFCDQHKLLPISLNEAKNELLVAVFEPIQVQGALDILREASRKEIRLYLAPWDALEQAINAAYPHEEESLSISPSLSISLANLTSNAPLQKRDHFSSAPLPKFSPQRSKKDRTPPPEQRLSTLGEMHRERSQHNFMQSGSDLLTSTISNASLSEPRFPSPKEAQSSFFQDQTAPEFEPVDTSPSLSQEIHILQHEKRALKQRVERLEQSLEKILRVLERAGLR